ncbi:unnamed protein product [Pleuronectes platessa]|uniref:Uncharacterized protein n=1 Tax=Pleuronectes platessa TaxID=8262 RepID=A0A9N7YCK4_PLEPL|nr:unnamed protein product [Pleuronectes platessa]
MPCRWFKRGGGWGGECYLLTEPDGVEDWAEEGGMMMRKKSFRKSRNLSGGVGHIPATLKDDVINKRCLIEHILLESKPKNTNKVQLSGLTVINGAGWLWQGAWLALDATDETHLQSISTHHPPHKGLVFPPLQCRIIYYSTHHFLVSSRITQPASTRPLQPPPAFTLINSVLPPTIYPSVSASGSEPDFHLNNWVQRLRVNVDAAVVEGLKQLVAILQQQCE